MLNAVFGALCGTPPCLHETSSISVGQRDDILKANAAYLDFLMPQYYNGFTRPAVDGLSGTGAGSVAALDHYNTLVNDMTNPPVAAPTNAPVGTPTDAPIAAPPADAPAAAPTEAVVELVAATTPRCGTSERLERKPGRFYGLSEVRHHQDRREVLLQAALRLGQPLSFPGELHFRPYELLRFRGDE